MSNVMEGNDRVGGGRAGVDRAGVVCSLVCAVHCTSTAVFPSLLVALGLSALVGPLFEWGFTMLAILVASTALVIGWRQHGVAWILLAFAAGIAGLAAGRLLEAADVHGVGTIVSITAGLSLAVAHIASIRANRSWNRARYQVAREA